MLVLLGSDPGTSPGQALSLPGSGEGGRRVVRLSPLGRGRRHSGGGLTLGQQVRLFALLALALEPAGAVLALRLSPQRVVRDRQLGLAETLDLVPEPRRGVELE